jgi:alpha-galactosidase
MARGVKIAFIGAGSIVFARKLLGDVFLYPELGDATVCLMDVDERRLGLARKIAEELKAEHVSRAAIESTTDLGSAVADAGYVINVVQIGGSQATYADFDIPEKYGLQQTIADTHGISGMMRFLRTVGHLDRLVGLMSRSCPHALLLNFTNPMSMCQWYIATASNLTTVGLCHSVPETIKQVSHYVGVDPADVDFTVAGINHMAWLLKFQRGREDLYPRLRASVDDPSAWSMDPVRFEILRNFSFFVTESSEHMAEYVPYFLKDRRLIEKLGIPVREHVRRTELNERALAAEAAYYLLGDATMKGAAVRMKAEYYSKEGKVGFQSKGPGQKPTRSDEYAIQIIHAIETGQAASVYGIVPNRGLVENLAPDCMVEVPIRVERTGLHPLQVGRLPDQLAALNSWHINMQRVAVGGAVSRSRRDIHFAALLDPLAGSILSMQQIHDLTEEMLAAHRQYLPAGI